MTAVRSLDLIPYSPKWVAARKDEIKEAQKDREANYARIRALPPPGPVYMFPQPPRR